MEKEKIILSDAEMKIVKAMRLGAKLDVAFLQDRSYADAKALIKEISPDGAKLEKYDKRGTTWMADYSGDADFDLAVFYDIESDHAENEKVER